MKTKIINHLAITFFVLCPVLSKCQVDNNLYLDKSNLPFQQKIQHSAVKDTTILPDRFFWGEINAGYANHGPAGSMTFNFRSGKLLFIAQYNKSHTCYENSESGEYSFYETNSENHFTVESMSALSGIILPGKWNPSFSLGVSWTHFTYMTTVHIEHDFTVQRVWETIINRDYKQEKLSTRTINAIGIPAEFKLHFASKHFVGFDAGIKADVNLHSTAISAELGIRFGRITKKRIFIH